MNKKIYNLCYVKDNKIKKIEFDKELNTLEQIDEFTTSFNDEKHLLKVLKILNLIPEEINKIYISCDAKIDNNTVQNIIYDGDILLFLDDKNKLKIEYVRFIFEKYKEETTKLLKLAKEYLKKYKNAQGMIPKVKSIINYANIKNETGFYNLGYDEITELNKDIDHFINKEFYQTKKDKRTARYSNIRDFLIKEKYVEGIYDTDRKHSYLKYNYIQEYYIKTSSKNLDIEEIEYEKEEFCTMEDYLKINKEISHGYNQNFDAYQEGNDYIAPLTEEEIEESLNDYAKKYSLKPGDGDLY